MAYVLDSSVWVALFLDFDTEHQRAVRLFDDLKGILYVPYCVVAETATILSYKHSKKQADNFLVYLENNADIVLINDDLKEEINFYRPLSDKISFTDAALLFLSQKLNAELITFDKQLTRIVRKHGG